MQEEFKKYKSSTSEELLLGIDNFTAAEEHLIEVAGKTDNKELQQDCRELTNKLRQIRQDIMNSAGDIVYG